MKVSGNPKEDSRRLKTLVQPRWVKSLKARPNLAGKNYGHQASLRHRFHPGVVGVVDQVSTCTSTLEPIPALHSMPGYPSSCEQCAGGLCQRWGQSGSRFHQGGLSWALTQELHMTSLQVVDAALDLNLPCSNLRAECHGKLLFPKTSKDHDTLEIEGTKYIQMHPNTLHILDVNKPHSKERCF